MKLRNAKTYSLSNSELAERTKHRTHLRLRTFLLATFFVFPGLLVASPPSFSVSPQYGTFDVLTETGILQNLRTIGIGPDNYAFRERTTGVFIEEEGFRPFAETITDELVLPDGYYVSRLHFDTALTGRTLLFLTKNSTSKGAFWTEDDQLITFDSTYDRLDLRSGEVNDSGSAAVTFQKEDGNSGIYTYVPTLVSPDGDTSTFYPPGITFWGKTGIFDFDSGIANVSNEAFARAINSENAIVCSAEGMVYDETFDDHFYRKWSFIYKDGEVIENDLPHGATDINDSGEVVGFFSGRTWLYLPEDNYGLGAGVHTLISSQDNPHNAGVVPRINNDGIVVWTGSGAQGSPMLWKDSQMHFISHLVNTDEQFEILKVVGINSVGGILVSDRTMVDFGDGNPVPRDGMRILSGASISITVDEEDELVEGQEFVARLTISHAGITGATYQFPRADEGVFLTTSPEDRIEILEADIPPSVDLSAVQPSVSYPVRCKVLKRGLVTLRAEVSSTPAGDDQSTLLSGEKELFIDPLEVTMQMIPDVDDKPIVNVELVDDGEGNISVTDTDGNPVTPKVKVTITNQGEDALEVFLQGVDPRARDKSAVPGRIRTLGDFPIELGTIAGNTTVEREIDLEFHEDGRFEFNTLVTAGISGSGATSSKTVSGAPLAVGEPFPVEIEVEVADSPAISEERNGAYFIQPGGTVRVIAAVDNKTTNATLQFRGMRAEKSFNALGGHITSDDGNAVPPPFIHDHEVEANGSAILWGLILTDKEGAPAGTVQWEGLEDIKLIDDETGDETDLSMDDVLVIREDGGWKGNNLAVRVIQDNDRPPAPVISTAEGVAIYGKGVMIGIGAWTYDTFDAIGGIGRFAGSVSGNPSLLADAWGESSRAVWEGAELAATTWKEMTDEQRQELVGNVTTEVARRATYYIFTPTPFDLEDQEAMGQWVNDTVYSFMGGVTDAYASDDPTRISDMWGQVSGQIGMEVVTALIPGDKFTRYVPASELTKLAKNQELGKALTTQEQLLRTIKAGPVDVATAHRVFGVGAEDISDFMTVFRKFKVKGYARERAPVSYKLINEWGEAVWKPENMKPKGFSELDGLIIGGELPTLPGLKDPSRTIELQGVTAIFWPESDFLIRSRLAAQGTPDYVIRAALSRAADRREEFQKFAPKFNKWKDTHFSVAKNYLDNGVPDPLPLKTDKRDFDFDVIDLGPNRPQIRIPKMANIDGDIRYISGDIDWVHFSFLDGSPLDPDTAAKLYDALCRCCGVQHPETISWLRNGQSVFKAKANQIVNYVRGQKALFELSEYGPRAVHISENLTRFSTNNRQHLIFFDEGIKSLERATLADIETAFAILQKLYPRPIITPMLWNTRLEDAGEDTTIGGNEWSYSTDTGEEIIVRQTSDGTTERFDGNGWVEWSPPSAEPSSPEQLAFSPQETGEAPEPSAGEPMAASGASSGIALSPTSSLDRYVSAGSQFIEVVNLPELWEAELEGRVDAWFAPGQTIIIAPGELTQEIHVVAAVDPFKLEQALRYDHPEGTIVAVLPEGMTPAMPSATASELLSTFTENGQVRMVWSSIPWALYTLEVADDETLTTWTALQEGIFSDTVSLSVYLSSESYDEEAVYRLRHTGDTPSPLNFSAISMNPVAGTITLEWLNDGGQDYLVEVSETLEPDSWGVAVPTVEIYGDVSRATLPLDSDTVPAQFYRARKAGEPYAGGGSFQILGITYDDVESELTITWSAQPGESYVVESKPQNGPETWESVAENIMATEDRVTLVLDLPDGTEPGVYRLRETE